MLDFKSMFRKIKKSHLQVVGVLLLISLAFVLLWFNESTSSQSELSQVPKVYFEGKYQIDGGEWHDIKKDEHIPATQGVVTLLGNFYFYMSIEGEEVTGIYRDVLPIMIYSDHINLTVYDGENGSVTDDIESTLCGENWSAYFFESPEYQEIKIVIQNPHKFGNETAIDKMLASFAIQDELRLYEKNALKSGEPQRNVGLVFIMGSVMLLGIALFSTLIHIKNTKIIWVLGGLVLFAGLYFAYSSSGVFLWSDSIALNTTVLNASMMLYMFFFTMLIVCLLTKLQKVGMITVILLGISNAVCFILPMVSDVLFYDMLMWWIVVQSIANLSLVVCIVSELITSNINVKWIYAGALLPIFAFTADVFGVWSGSWDGGVVSQYVFSALFVVAFIMVLSLVPKNINAAAKAKELEVEKINLNAQLAESRISTMMSQIRPHFIYNTLGSIEQLCKLDPPKAGDLVHNFAKYLRGNFGELDNPKPILMSQEMEHVHHYISIENVRFPDMTFTFEMNSTDFKIPALTIQPIVENAIKHGLMKLAKGGTIRVISYETDSDYCISVEDDGVGFDTNALLDERKHVGLRNIRERLKVMVNGTLEIESTIGVGTKVLIKIPKEVQG